MSSDFTSRTLGVAAEMADENGHGQRYQTEQELESEFIRILRSNGIEYLQITDESSMIKNLRTQLCRLNNVIFSDKEWKQIFGHYIANNNESIEDKTTKVHEDHIYNLRRDDDSLINVRILDKRNIHNNHVQVINQYESKGVRSHRYDVTILVNGFPMVHVELKRRGVKIREAFNQIDRYQRDSFWSGSGLFEYVQLFVISNGTNTKYYSNTVRNDHLKEQKSKRKSRQTSHSFEFTNWWTDIENKRIPDLEGFTRSFFAKDCLLEILTKYCVFTSQKLLLVMRPYQINATKSILNRICVSTSHNQLGTTEAGGFIWHSTGSGKTLTSFKTAQLACALPGVQKVLFIVDRKDLDYQTMREYDKFQKGCANSNTSTSVLTRQLGDPNAKIIITTIQKMARFIKFHHDHRVYHDHVVLIFDECHRSQFGSMHKNIKRSFKKFNIFGFTGTPIFSTNSLDASSLQTTQQAFGIKLHDYTIVDAIRDENVLPLKIDYFNTLKMKDYVDDKEVCGIDEKSAALSSQRITGITKYILKNFHKKTKRESQYSHDSGEVLNGFNSLFAVSSIEAAKKYYTEFSHQIRILNTDLKIATIFSFTEASEESEDSSMGFLPDEDFDTSKMPLSSKDFLEQVIQDYNQHFGTSYDTSSDKFENYYKDLSCRMKNREIDLLIVVNMFLTGFDATTLNTLWVDKNLRYHGLIQAFSRTNRILNSIKKHGNIICFRDLQKATDEALSLFGNDDVEDVVLIRPYQDYYRGWTDNDGTPQKGYQTLIEELQTNFPITSVMTGEQAEKDFISLWGECLRRNNVLSSFDEFSGQEILSKVEFQDYQSLYLDLYDKYRKSRRFEEKETITDDIEFEIELVKRITVNIDYILKLMAKKQTLNAQDQQLLSKEIEQHIDASLDMRSKKDLIMSFMNKINTESHISEEWRQFIDEQKSKDLEKIIAEENLDPQKTRAYLDRAFRDGELKSKGTRFASIMPPTSMFDADHTKEKTKMMVLEKLESYFEKYCL